jgi:hypothetical protein
MKKHIILLALILSGCSEEVTWQTQEDMRAIARENSAFNAKIFRTENSKYAGWSLFLRGDSTIGKHCASGDGWATVDIEDPLSKQTVQLKCSTVSKEIGCMTKDDFVKRPYASEDGACNTNIPVPLPKIQA